MELKELGDRIRQARNRAGLTQEKLAQLMTRDQAAISAYERGERALAAIDIPRLAEALNVPVNYFYEGEQSLNDLDRLMLQELRRLPDDVARQSAIELVRVFCDALVRRG